MGRRIHQQMNERPRFQFRMRDLLWAMSLAAAGVALNLPFLRSLWSGDEVAVLAAVVFVGAGVLVSFGAVLGCLLSIWFAVIDGKHDGRSDDRSPS